MEQTTDLELHTLLIQNTSLTIREECLKELLVRHSRQVALLRDRVEILETLCAIPIPNRHVKNEILLCRLNNHKHLVHCINTGISTLVTLQSTSNREELELLAYAYDTYKDARYYVQSEYLYRVFNLWIDRWESTGYVTAKGGQVKNCDLLKLLYSRGFRGVNICMMSPQHVSMIESERDRCK
jgi:hypothetical protein